MWGRISRSARPDQARNETLVKVEIWSDVVCPWCYIGKRRFEAALARFEHAGAVEVEYRSFQLDPSAPRRFGMNSDAMLAQKYGMSLARAQEMHTTVTQLAAAEGLAYRFDLARPGNTFDAHRVLQLATERGLQHAAWERFYRGYFIEGEPIGDHEALVRMATDVGLDGAEVQAVLAGDAYADAVRADLDQAAAFGITGVPFFVLDRKYGVSGAQPAGVILQALEQAWAERAVVPQAAN